MDIATQIAEELGRALAEPARLLGWTDIADLTTARIRARVPVLAGQLLQDDDDMLAAQTVIDVMCVLFPDGDPEPDWWRTPLGRACARSLGRDDAESVSQSAAAAMLGVTRGTVAQLVHRGTLDRHPDGGVLRSAVLARIARMSH